MAWLRAPLRLLLAAAALGHFAPAISNGPRAQLTRPFHLHLGARIPLRDGIRLNAAVYRPADGQRHPVLFVVTPYTVDRWASWAGYFAANGYVFVIVDARGRGDSEGNFEPWIREGEDGADVVDWLSRQPFSDGRVGAWGGSYSGKNQWAIATLSGPSLKTMAPAGTGYVGYDMGMLRNIPFPGMQRWLTFVSGRTVLGNLNRDDAYWSGAYADLSKGEVRYRDFDRLSGNPTALWQQWVDHPAEDEYWARGTPSAKALNGVRIPVLAVTGSYDDAQLGTLRYWGEHQGNGPPKKDSYLVIGPWDHPGTREPQAQLGGLRFAPASVLDIKRLNLDWYDWTLKGGPRPQFLKDHFVYYVAGSERWTSAPSIAAATESRERLYLSSAGRPASSLAQRGALSRAPPRAETDFYVDDPSIAAFNEGPEGSTAVSPNFLTDDRIPRRLSGDGLLYDSAPFASDRDMVGRPSADLFIALDVPDADFRVQLYEVRPDGSSIFLGQDQMRARYRLSDRVPSMPPIGKTELYRFDRFPFVSRTIGKGSVVRLLICPLGASIHQQRNRHSGGIVADETAKDNRIARVGVHLGPRLSSIILPFGGAGT